MVQIRLSFLVLFLLGTACSSRTQVFNQDKKLSTNTQPTYIVERHENLDTPITISFKMTYSSNEKTRIAEREAGLIEAIKTVYLLTYRAPAQDTSDFRLTNCASYRFKGNHLVCSNASDAKAWKIQDSKNTLSEYYWQERFHTIYQEDLTDKPGVYWEQIENLDASLELGEVKVLPETKIQIAFSFNRPLLKPRSHFPLYSLHLLDQRAPTIHLSSINNYLAVRQTNMELAPVIGLSTNLQQFIRRHVIQMSKEQGLEIVAKIDKLMQSLSLEKYALCPLNTSLCEFRPYVDFQDASQVQNYLYKKQFREHLFGLMLLAHTTVSTNLISENQEEYLLSIDMKKLLTSYKIQFNKAFIDSTDLPL